MSPVGSTTSCVVGLAVRATPVPPVFPLIGDNLPRIFGGDRVAGLMNAFRVEEDMPIESACLLARLRSSEKVETYY